MSSPALMRAHEQVLRFKAATARAREKAGETMETALTTGETVGSAFAFGLWEGRVSDPKHFELAGIPIPLVVGVGAHAFALLGVGRGMESHFRALGNGALAAHLNGVGRRMGQEWEAKSNNPFAKSDAAKGVSGVAGVGELPPSRRGVGVTQRDLERLAA